MSLEIVKNYEIYMLKAERSIFRTMNRHEQCNVAVTEADAGSKAKVGTPYATTLNPSVSRGFQLLCGTLLNIRPRRGEFHESLLAAANPGTAANVGGHIESSNFQLANRNNHYHQTCKRLLIY